MGCQEDSAEIERIERRNKRIKELLEPESSNVEEEKPAGASVDATSEPAQPRLVPALRAWERVIKGRREQWRPLTEAERLAEDEREWLRSVKKQADEHAKKVEQADRDNRREQKRLDDQRERELRTGKRPLRDPNRISLAEAARRGLIGQSSGSDNNGREEWYSEKNPEGRLCGG